MNDTLIPGQLYRFNNQPGILKFSHYGIGSLLFKHHSEKHNYGSVGQEKLIPFTSSVDVKKFKRVSQIIEVW